MKKFMSFLLVGSMILIIAGVLFLYSNGNSSDEENRPKTEQSEQASDKEKSKYISYSPGESFITNIKDSSKYLKMKVVLELRNEKSKKYFEQNNYKIKDIIIGVLRSKTEAQLTADNSKELLKDSIRAVLAERLDMKDLIDIYIEEFVIQ